mmetsp:Transcript_2997/g.4534  ORF Transcript_2997/g.4534 Transcript_2997/m.4534 type:complete len:101 (+) Transcript_2997:362-664(+)
MEESGISAEKDCLIYSGESNSNFSFEQEVHNIIVKHCKIHTFDPGNYTEGGKQNDIHYHMWGIDKDIEGENSRHSKRRLKSWGIQVVPLISLKLIVKDVN